MTTTAPEPTSKKNRSKKWRSTIFHGLKRSRNGTFKGEKENEKPR
jgi:hypothetical protein